MIILIFYMCLLRSWLSREMYMCVIVMIRRWRSSVVGRRELVFVIDVSMLISLLRKILKSLGLCGMVSISLGRFFCVWSRILMILIFRIGIWWCIEYWINFIIGLVISGLFILCMILFIVCVIVLRRLFICFV